MSLQTSLDSYFKHKAQVTQSKMNVEKKAKKRSLSLTRYSEKYKTPKKEDHKTSEVQSHVIEEEVICLSSSSEDLLMSVEKRSQDDQSVDIYNRYLSSSQEKSQAKKNNAKKNVDSPNTSVGSSSTIIYNLSPKTSQQTPRTPIKTPSTPKSGKKFFSPTKKRAVTNKNSAKRNLNMQFKENNQQNSFQYETSYFKTFQDDKSK